MSEIRALEIMSSIPAGCITHFVCDEDCEPHIHLGECAIIDTNDTEPQSGEVYLIRWASGATSIKQLFSRPFTSADHGERIGFWTRCLNFVPYNPSPSRKSETGIPVIGRRSYADGPRLAETIRKALLGRGVGVYAAPDAPLMLKQTEIRRGND